MATTSTRSPPSPCAVLPRGFAPTSSPQCQPRLIQTPTHLALYRARSARLHLLIPTASCLPVLGVTLAALQRRHHQTKKQLRIFSDIFETSRPRSTACPIRTFPVSTPDAKTKPPRLRTIPRSHSTGLQGCYDHAARKTFTRNHSRDEPLDYSPVSWPTMHTTRAITRIT